MGGHVPVAGRSRVAEASGMFRSSRPVTLNKPVVVRLIARVSNQGSARTRFDPDALNFFRGAYGAALPVTVSGG